MKKTILTAALLSACVANTSFALNLFSIHKNFGSKPTIKTTKTNENGNYTDFSGTWSGTCAGGDESETGAITIKNDAINIEIDGEQFSLGTIKTESSSDKLHSDFSHTIINWNEDRTELLFEATSTDYHHSDYPYNKSIPLFTALLKGNIALNKDQLTVKIEEISFNGLSQSNQKISTSCTFDKLK
jgi:hypothetical protein